MSHRFLMVTFYLPYPDPVPDILTGHQRLQVVSAHVVRRSLIYLLGHPLHDAHWYIPDGRRREKGKWYYPGVFPLHLQFLIHISKSSPLEKTLCIPAHEGEPLQHEAACLLYTSGVWAPMFQTKISEVSEDVQSFTGRYVPVSPFLYLSENPGLNESTSVEKQHQKQIFFYIYLRLDVVCVVGISPCNHNSRNSRLLRLHGILIRQNVSITWENQ